MPKTLSQDMFPCISDVVDLELKTPLIAVGCNWAKNKRRRKHSFILFYLISVMIAALPKGSDGVWTPQVLNIVTLIHSSMHGQNL